MRRIARSDKPDSMPRLATKGRKVEKARGEANEEASQARSDREKPSKRRRGRRRGGKGARSRKSAEKGERTGWPHQGEDRGTRNKGEEETIVRNENT